jgi:L-fuculose-phosphate aldolase
MKSENQHREEIVRIGRMLYEREYIGATEGNLSARVNDRNILCTPTGFCKGMLCADDLVLLDPSDPGSASWQHVSSEIGMHLLIYRMRPDVGGVVHAHPVTATGFAVAGVALDKPIIAELVVTLGSVPLAPYGTPGTDELSDALEPLVPHHDALLMANHGVVTYGRDLVRAFRNMELVEHVAKISLVSQLLGNQQLLSADAVRKLLSIRNRYQEAEFAEPVHSNK